MYFAFVSTGKEKKSITLRFIKITCEQKRFFWISRGNSLVIQSKLNLKKSKKKKPFEEKSNCSRV